MKNSLSFPPDKQRRRLPWAALVSAAVIFTALGMLIAANFDLSPHSVAQVPTNMSQTGLFPVVDRDGVQESPFVSVVDRAADAVVNISAKTKDTERPWWVHGSGYSTSLGSGFFFREDGYVITNNHVIKDAVEMTVRTSSGYEYEARLVGADPQTDLAVIKVDPEEEISVIPFGSSSDIKVGDWAIAIGNPFPQQGLDRSVTVGVVSAKGRSSLRFGQETPFYQNYIQTDAAINPGNSGGPLLNLRGECIGVNAAISSPTGSSVGIGFAIPIDLARAIVPDLIASGKATRGWLGVWLSDLTERQAKSQGLDAVRGVVIDSVFAGSPAERAGFKRGDVVVNFDGQAVANASQFSVLVSTVRQGNVVPVEVFRDRDRMTLKTTVGDRDTFLASAETQNQYVEDQSEIWLGMELIDYTPDIAREIGARHIEGVYVTHVFVGTPAERASITTGSILIKIDNKSVKSIRDIRELAGQIGRSDRRIPVIVQEPDGSVARKVLRY
ncbi:MAG: PDZ domain-containing protein [bacterium]|nr:PDZ domain-containing protein [bacterium]